MALIKSCRGKSPSFGESCWLAENSTVVGDVRMDENHCEGMVPMNAIPGDRFRFDQDSFRIVGSRTKKEYNFGDRVKVRIYEVSPRKRQVDLELIEV